jgi:hypothetical protein
LSASFHNTQLSGTMVSTNPPRRRGTFGILLKDDNVESLLEARDAESFAPPSPSLSVSSEPLPGSPRSVVSKEKNELNGENEEASGNGITEETDALMEPDSPLRPIDVKDDALTVPDSPLRPIGATTSLTSADALSAWLERTKALYAQVADYMDNVTLKDFYAKLQAAAPDYVLTKEHKPVIRQRLTELIAQRKAGQNDKEEDEPEEDEEDESVDSQADNEENDNDAWETAPRRRRGKKKQKRPLQNKSSTALARRVHQESLRQCRLQELRVRQEELQSRQSAADQERAALIAEKFRPAPAAAAKKCRLDLLRQLHDKRAALLQLPMDNVNIDNSSSVKPKEENSEPVSIMETPLMETPLINSSTIDIPEDDAAPSELKAMDDIHREEDAVSLDDDDDELEVVDPPTRTHDSLAILTLSSPQPRQGSRSANARAVLCRQLQAQRLAKSQAWLTRGLDFGSTEEMLQARWAQEEEKKRLVLQQEAVRLAQQQRQLKRQEESMLQDDEEENPSTWTTVGEEFLAKSKKVAANDEEDEELKLAEALEQEAQETAGDEDDEQEREGGDIDQEMDGGQNDREAEGDENDQGNENREKEEEHDGNEPHKSGTGSKSTTDDQIKDAKDDGPTVDSAPAVATSDHEPMQLTMGAAVDSDQTSKDDTQDDNEESEPRENRPRNTAWKAMLEKDAAAAKKQKKFNDGLIEAEADEEEEEEDVAGLEDFGFTVSKKKKDDDEDEEDLAQVDEDDLEDVVDDLSDGEGDEDAGEKARRALERQEEKRRHKEMLRRVREGHDGRRRGGIAAGGLAGARGGVLRFDQLVAADNAEEAKALGLANDDEWDDDEIEGKKPASDNADGEEEDEEAVLLDRLIKERHSKTRAEEEEEERFSEAEDEEDVEEANEVAENTLQEDQEQEKLARRFTKRARMQRLIERYGHEEEFSQSRLIEEDATLKLELQQMKVRPTTLPP